MVGDRGVHQHAGGAPARGVDDVEPPAGQLHGVAGGRDAAQLVGDDARERLVRAVRNAEADRPHLVGAGRAVGGPELAPVRVLARRGQVRRLVRVVLVTDLADDLLDDVLQGGDARGAAVLVDDDGHRLLPGEAVEQPVHGQRLGHEQRLAQQLADPAVRPLLGRYGQDVLDVGDADDRVQAAPVDGEAGQAGRAGRVGDVLRGGLHLEGGDLDAGRHHVLGGQFRQVEGADEQLGRVRLQGALLGGVPGERHQLLRGAGGGQLLGRLHPEPAQDAVGGVVEVADQRLEGGREDPLRGGDHLRDRERRGDRPVLGDQLADHHQDDGGQGGADDERHRGGDRGGEAEVLDRAADQLGDRGLGQHADDQVGDGDAQLGAGELEGQRPDGLERPGGSALAAPGGRFELAALDGGQRELGRDEGTARDGEEERQEEQKHFGHRFTSVP